MDPDPKASLPRRAVTPPGKLTSNSGVSPVESPTGSYSLIAALKAVDKRTSHERHLVVEVDGPRIGRYLNDRHRKAKRHMVTLMPRAPQCAIRPRCGLFLNGLPVD